MDVKSSKKDLTENWYKRVSEVADQDFSIAHSKFKMADTIW